MKTIVLIAALATSFAAPAFAQTPLEIGVGIFNASADRASDRIVLSEDTLTTGATASGRNSSVLLEAVDQFNSSADRASDRIDPEFLTTFSGPETTGRAAEIFACLAAESHGDS